MNNSQVNDMSLFGPSVLKVLHSEFVGSPVVYLSTTCRDYGRAWGLGGVPCEDSIGIRLYTRKTHMSSVYFLPASRWLISWPHKSGDQSQKCARDFGHVVAMTLSWCRIWLNGGMSKSFIIAFVISLICDFCCSGHLSGCLQALCDGLPALLACESYSEITEPARRQSSDA